jgi:hypothetical protein
MAFRRLPHLEPGFRQKRLWRDRDLLAVLE